MKYLANSTMQVMCALAFALAAPIACVQRVSRQPIAGDQTSSGLTVALADTMQAILAAALGESAFPGAYAVVGDSRGILAEHGVGRLDWSESPRPDRHTIWDLASLTKVIGTTTAAAQLVERGLVDVDAPVRRYLPDWTGPGKETVTVRHLLTHTSGLPAFRPYDQQTKHRDSIATLIFNTELERAPGERMVYSDIGAFVLGEIVARVSGQPLDRYIAEHITRPLAMRETLFNPAPALLSRIAPTEIDSIRGGLVRGAVHDERAYYLGGVAAHAGMFSSAHDLSRFATMMLRGGALDGVRILQPETIARFTGYADSLFSNRALGWQKMAVPGVRYRTSAAWGGEHMSRRSYGHTGFTGTSIALDPALDLYIILLSNRVNPTRNNPRIGAVRSRLADAIVMTVRQHRGQTTNAENP